MPNRPRPGPRNRRDRRARGLRGPLLPAGMPAARSRAERFADLVRTEADRLLRRRPGELGRLTVTVTEVPAQDADPVALFAVWPGTADRPARLVVHRRPVEARADGRLELADLVRDVVVEAVAELVGRSPQELDPGRDDD